MTIRLFLLGALALTACKPDYPKCKKDDHCHKGEFCIDGLCQQCRDNADCEAGQSCNKGRCDKIEGWCDSASDCPAGQGCKDHACGACTDDGQCGAGGQCRDGKCRAPRSCTTEADCADDEECIDGRCVAPPAAAGERGPCTLEPVYYGFNESALSDEATGALARDAECLKQAGDRRVRLEGHCDPRGTEEYNLALGDKRARGAMSHLRRLGVDGKRMRPVSRGKIDASGSDEGSYTRDRRVELLWE